jgi:hypothetical protein
MSVSKPRVSRRGWFSCAAGILLSLIALPCAAATPDWLRAAARASLPPQPHDVDAVVLLSEQNTTVQDEGEMRTVFRMAYRILRPDGRRFGNVRVDFDDETRLTLLKGWSITAEGVEYEAKEQDAVESSISAVALYHSTRFKLLIIPGAKTGAIVGYEYEQKRRPRITQDVWDFQETIPVRLARYSLDLPDGWEFDRCWSNFQAREPRREGEHRWVWELENLPAVEHEALMPAWQAVAGRLGISYYPSSGRVAGARHSSWPAVARWFNGLAADRRQSTPEMRAKVKELTDTAATTEAKIQGLAAFVQRDVRYVAIEVGIGGYQPHTAGDVFINHHGDCKDKATLLSAMLREVGVDSFYVLVNANRGVLNPSFPSLRAFNHVILAIRSPAPTTNRQAEYKHPTLGPLVFFDPTSTTVPYGQLPGTLQANTGLLVTEDGGELVMLPLAAPPFNRLLRTVKLAVNEQGDATCDVEDLRWGAHAAMRHELIAATQNQRAQMMENALAGSVPAFRLIRLSFGNLEAADQLLSLSYGFTAPAYAQVSGDLLLLRPRILGRKTYDDLLTPKERRQPVEFESTLLDTDIVEITLPPGYALDEASSPTDLKLPFARYTSSVKTEGTKLVYKRYFELTQVRIPLEQTEELKRFFRRVASDERAVVVLKRSSP